MVKQLLSIFAAAAVSFGAYADDPVLFKTYEATWEYYSDNNEEGLTPDASGTRTLQQYSDGTYKILNAFGSDAKKDVLTFVLTNDNITFQGLKENDGVKYLYYNSPKYSYVYDTLYENGEYSSYSKEDGWDTVMFYISGSAGDGYYYLYWQGEEIPKAYLENKASVDELTEAYAAGVKDLEETFPGYLVVKSEELTALKEQIDALAKQVNDALAEAGKTGEYDGPATSEINEVTASLIALLFSGPEEAQAAIYEAAEADYNQLYALYAEVEPYLESDPQNALAGIIAQSLSGLQEQLSVVALGEAMGTTGVYESPLTEEVMAQLKTQVESLVAYENDKTAIVELVTAYSEGVQGLQETFPGYLVVNSEELEALNAQIEALAQEMNAALEEAVETGIYEGPSMRQIREVTNSLIVLLVSGPEETMMVVNEAYENDKAIIERLQAEYTECVKSVDSDFPGYLVLKKADLAALQSQIDGLAKKVETAYKAALESGYYVGLTSEEMSVVENSINSLLVTGSDAQLDVIWDGVREDYSKIKTLRDDVEAYLANNPENELVAEILQQLDELQAQITEVAMKKAVEETGVYETPLNEEVMAELNAKIEDLKTSGIAAIEAAGAEARYFDINGREVNHPVSGKVYIKVENQKASKVMVK